MITKGNFLVHVQYRKNSTWQGAILWADKNESIKFRGTLELIYLIDSALDIAEKEMKERKEDKYEEA